MIPPASCTPPAASTSTVVPPLDVVMAAAPSLPVTSAFSSPHHSPMMIEPSLEPAITPLALRIDQTRGKKRTANDDASGPSSPINTSASDGRHIIPLKSTRRVKSAPLTSPTLSPRATPAIVTSVATSREASPGPAENAGSSPVKRPRTSSISGDITNFHILPSSDDESDDPMSSPSVRMRNRFNQLLGPSPLQKSFSSTAVPQVALPTSPIPPMERAHTTPAPSIVESPMKMRTRSMLTKVDSVEALGTEMNKVFMLSYGRGMGMGSTGGGRSRRGSMLKPRDAVGASVPVKQNTARQDTVMEQDEDSGVEGDRDDMDLDH